jgi:hypothetical protein
MGGRRHLVVVVPGIGGSVLAQSGRRSDPDSVVWDAGFAALARLGTSPRRLSLAESGDVVPAGLVRSRTLLPGWTVLPGYDRLLGALGRMPGAVLDTGDPARRVAGANVVAFGYDFRRSIVDSAEKLAGDVADRLEKLGWSWEPGRVIVVGDSMGGLVARYWVACLDGWRVCRSLITLGTPHRGAPKALAWLTGGVRIGGHDWREATKLIRGWQSVVELMPRYPAVLDTSSGEPVPCYPYQLPIGWLHTRAKKAFAVHQDISTGWRDMPRRPEFVPRIGWSHPTLDATWWNGAELVMGKQPSTWLNAPEWESDLGDGTVPAISALPIEEEHHAEELDGIRVGERHGRLSFASSMVTEIVERIERYEARSSSPQVPGSWDGEQRTATLGIDVDDVYPAGTPIQVQVRIHHAPDEGRGARVAVEVQALDTREAEPPDAPVRIRLQWDSQRRCYEGEIPPPPEGIFDLRITAEAVPGVGDLQVTESVAVIEPDPCSGAATESPASA